MNSALGWLVAALVGLTGGLDRGSPEPRLSYQFQVVELHGLKWREAALSVLRPVTRQGAVQVWTAPRDFLRCLPEESLAGCLTVPCLSAAPQTPAHLTTKKHRVYVCSEPGYRGAELQPAETQSIREGLTATIAGRKLDQGVLVQLVLEDTDVRAIHTIPLEPATRDRAVRAASATFPEGSRSPTCCPGVSAKQVDSPAIGCEGSGIGCKQSSDAPEKTCHRSDVMGTTAQDCCKAACPRLEPSAAKDLEARRSGWKPTGETPQCQETQRAEMEAATEPASGAREPGCSAPDAPETVIQIPEVGQAAAAGEWLIPNGECLVIGLGVHTTRGQEGQAVVREKLVVVTAGMTGSGPGQPAIPPLELGIPTAPKTPPPGQSAGLGFPAMPSRTLPQGFHADGTPADLPPLPEDENPGTTTSSSSLMPSPQTRHQDSTSTSTSGPQGREVPATPAQAPSPPPPSDTATSRTSLGSKANAGLKVSRLLPLSISGFQFTLTVKPLTLKLPLGQTLEIDVVGRVVPDSQTGSTSEK